MKNLGPWERYCECLDRNCGETIIPLEEDDLAGTIIAAKCQRGPESHWTLVVRRGTYSIYRQYGDTPAPSSDLAGLAARDQMMRE